MKNVAAIILIAVLSSASITLQAQSDKTPTIYKGLFGDYTFAQFKAWSDSIDCKESALIRGVKTMKGKRTTAEGEKIFTSKMQIFPALVHCISSQDVITDYNGFLKIMEGGANIYLVVNQKDLKNVKKMAPTTDIICASLKSSIKGNATQARYLVQINEADLDKDVALYLKKNSLVLLKAVSKDINMCGESYGVRVRP